MNTPNKLTLLRVVLVPFFLAFLMINNIPFNYCLALVIFILASFTDMLDGYLARKNNQITTFGKFLDPLADKVLVLSAMICFIELNLASSVAIVIIIAREFMVTSIRLVALSGDGKVIPANMLGKIKTVVSMISVIATLAMLSLDQFIALHNYINISFISNILIWISAIITIVSGVQYLYLNKESVNTTK